MVPVCKIKKKIEIDEKNWHIAVTVLDLIIKKEQQRTNTIKNQELGAVSAVHASTRVGERCKPIV